MMSSIISKLVYSIDPGYATNCYYSLKREERRNFISEILLSLNSKTKGYGSLLKLCILTNSSSESLLPPNISHSFS